MHALSPLVLRHVSFCRWGDRPRKEELSQVYAFLTPGSGPFNGLSWSAVSVPHLSKEFFLVPLRECQEEKKWSRSCGHHAVGDAQGAMLTSGDLTVLSASRDHVNNVGPGLMVGLPNQDAQGVGKLASFLGEWTQALLGTLYRVWGLETTLNYLNHTLQYSHGMNSTHLKLTRFSYFLW